MPAIHYRYSSVEGQRSFYREALRDSRVPRLAVWRRNDAIFGPDGARAFAADAYPPEIHLLDGGHFLLESQLDAVAGYLRPFPDRTRS